MSAASAGRPSAASTPLPSTRMSTLGSDLTSAANAAGSLATAPTSSCTNGPTWVPSPTCAAECGKTFGHNSSLSLHWWVHTGARPYLCGDCGKAYISSSHLVQHRKVHTGAQLYECRDCGNSSAATPASRSIGGFTLGRNRSRAVSVGRPMAGGPTSLGTRGSTWETGRWWRKFCWPCSCSSEGLSSQQSQQQGGPCEQTAHHLKRSQNSQQRRALQVAVA